MSTLDAATAMAEKLTANGINATVDPRGATAPCVLILPPALTYDLGCGATAVWSLICLAPGPANSDAWAALDELRSSVVSVLPVYRSQFISYSLSLDAPLIPAYLLTYSESLEDA